MGPLAWLLLVSAWAAPAPGDLPAAADAVRRLHALPLDGGPGAATATRDEVDRALVARLQAREATLAEIVRLTEPPEGAALARAIELLALRAEALDDMRGALLRSFVPTYLTEDQQELYRSALADRSVAFATRALDSVRRAVAVANAADPAAIAGSEEDLLRLRAVAHRCWRAQAPTDTSVTEAGRARRGAAVAKARREAEEREARRLAERDATIAGVRAALADQAVCVPEETQAFLEPALDAWVASTAQGGSADHDAQLLLDMALAHLQETWRCEPAPPEVFESLRRFTVHDHHGGGWLPAWVEPTRPTGPPPAATAWTPATPPNPPVGTIVNPATLAARVAALRGWMEAWVDAVRATNAPPNGTDLRALGVHMARLTDAVDLLEADAAALLAHPSHRPAARVWLAEARVDQAAALVALHARLERPRDPVGGTAERWLVWAMRDRRTRVVQEAFRALDAVDDWLEPLLARTPAIAASPDVRVEALRVRALALGVAERAFPAESPG